MINLLYLFCPAWHLCPTFLELEEAPSDHEQLYLAVHLGQSLNLPSTGVFVNIRARVCPLHAFSEVIFTMAFANHAFLRSLSAVGVSCFSHIAATPN